MRSLVVALIALAPASALAQFTITLNTQQEEVSLGAEDCSSVVSVSWSLVASQLMCSDMVFWLTENASCGSGFEAGAEDVELERYAPLNGTSPHANSGTFTFPTSDLPLFQNEGAPACPAADEERSYRVCAAYQTPNSLGVCDGSSGRLGTTNPPLVTYDTRPPGPPTIDSAQPLDGAAAVTVSAEEGVTSVIVEATAEGHPTRTADQDIRNGRIVIDGLVNTVEYSITARARDLAENESEPSAAVTVTPVATAGFWQAYKDAGGAEDGGCSQAGGGALGLVALVAARIFRRRRS